MHSVCLHHFWKIFLHKCSINLQGFSTNGIVGNAIIRLQTFYAEMCLATTPLVKVKPTAELITSIISPLKEWIESTLVALSFFYAAIYVYKIQRNAWPLVVYKNAVSVLKGGTPSDLNITAKQVRREADDRGTSE